MLQIRQMSLRRVESRNNAQLKLARKIRDGRVRDRIFVEGVRLVEEAFRSDVQIEFAVIKAGLGGEERERRLIDSLFHRDVDVLELPMGLFETIADTSTSQGVIIIGKRPPSDRETFELEISIGHCAIPIVIMLTEVNDPSNLGAAVRTAEAAGAEGLIVTERSADVFSPKSLRAAMGSAFRLPTWAPAPFDAAFEWARSNGRPITAATGDGKTSYLDLDWKLPRLVAFGSEAHGVNDEILASATETVKIPIEPAVESLNLAVSVGVMLFEARRQCLAAHDRR